MSPRAIAARELRSPCSRNSGWSATWPTAEIPASWRRPSAPALTSAAYPWNLFDYEAEDRMLAAR